MPPHSEDEHKFPPKSTSLTMTLVQQHDLQLRDSILVADKHHPKQHDLQLLNIDAHHQRTRVRFASQDEVILVPEKEEFEDDVVWVSREALDLIRRQCKLLVYMIDKKTHSYDGDVVNGHPVRGLVEHSLAYTQTRDNRRNQMYDLIYAAQQCGHRMDDDAIAKVCSQLSLESVQEALKVGKSDYEAAYRDTIWDFE
eukprot:scaffold530_cov107-Cylindrotheca_fusiformis.AAC.7